MKKKANRPSQWVLFPNSQEVEHRAKVLTLNGFCAASVAAYLNGYAERMDVREAEFTRNAILGKKWRRWMFDSLYVARNTKTLIRRVPDEVEMERMLESFAAGTLLYPPDKIVIVSSALAPAPPPPDLPPPEKGKCGEPVEEPDGSRRLCGDNVQPGRDACAKHLTARYLRRKQMQKKKPSDGQRQLESTDA